MHVNTSFEVLPDALHLFSDTQLYGHVAAILILINCYEIMNSLKIRSFTNILYYKKFGAI